MPEAQTYEALLDEVLVAAEQMGMFGAPTPVKTELTDDERALFETWAATTSIVALERGWRALLAAELVNYRFAPLWVSDRGEEPRIFYVRRWQELKSSRR